MFRVVIEDLVIYLVGKNDEIVLDRHFHDLLEYFQRIHGTGRVVRVDEDYTPCPAGDLRFHVLDVGDPSDSSSQI